MSEWKEKTLGELTSYLAKGIPPKYTDDPDGNVIYVLNQKCNRDFTISYADARLHDADQKKIKEEKLVRPGDVLINSTGTGTAGRVAQIWDIPVPTTTDGHMILLRATDEIDPLYYGYAIKAYQAAIERLAEGSTGQTELNKQRLKDEIVIRYPEDKTEQHRIAQILKNIDDKIQTNNEIVSNLYSQLETSYLHLSEKNYPVPGWRHVCLGNVTTKENERVGDQELPVYSILFTGEMIPSEEHFNKKVYSKDIAQYFVVRKGCFAYNPARINIGAIAYNDKEDVAVSTLYVVVKTEPKYDNFFRFYFRSPEFNLETKNRASGSVRQYFYYPNFSTVEIEYPPEEVIDEFNKICDTNFYSIREIQKETTKLTELRDTLLPVLTSEDKFI